MCSLRLCLVAAVAVAALSCGGSAPQPAALSSRWSAPSILAEVPADAPYLFALLEPMNDAVRRRLMQNFDRQIAQGMKDLEKLRDGDPAKIEPWMRAVLAILGDMRNKGMANWFDELGIDPHGRSVLYGMSLWPVVRIELNNPAKLRAAITRAMTAAGVQPGPQRTLEGRSYWRSTNGEFTFVAGVLDREAVAAILPTASVDAALPEVLGIRPPGRSLASTPTVPELLARHRFLGLMLGYLDAHRVIDVLTGAQPRPLDLPIRAATGSVAPACRADLDRLAAAMPRLVFGYHRFDDTGFDGSMVLETPAATVAALRKLHAVVPEVNPRPAGHPLFAMGVALEPDQLIAWLQDQTRELHDHPFGCPWFTDLDEAAAKLSQKLATPLPPLWRGLRGLAVTIDDAAFLPPSVTGHVLIAGERVADLVKSLVGQVPAIAGIPLVSDGKPVALPTRQLKIPVPAHFALTTDRLVIAAGEGSEHRVTEHLATAAPKASPLLTMQFDVPRIQQIAAMFGESPVDGFGSLGDVGMGLDVGDAGVAFDVWGTWQPVQPAPAQIATPPARP
ncbi:MAG TPA: hypothetical protein VHW23_05860 [Kofleriaceae bacterium]|jgi:hypothetical protein|nr:hypothetical protein [Kofleriaceae bacterium]